MGLRKRTFRAMVILAAAVMMMGVLGGCSLLFGGDDESPTEEERVLVPTFTPTPMGAAPVEQATPTTAAVVVAPVAPAAPAAAAPALTDTQALTNTQAVTGTQTSTDTQAAEQPTPEPATATPVPKLIVSNDSANVRNGPGTEYGLAGTVTQGQTFDIVGKNPDGTWWQFCCVNGQQAWIFGELVGTENADSVAVAADIPAPPVAAAPVEPVPAQPEPAQPEPAQPAPEDTPAPAPPPATDACAGIGGDGCKFHVRGGPNFGGNGGQEIKLQLFFIHSGVDGGQPQGSYFVALFKDGVKLPIPDSVRSRSLDKSDGALGPFNYEIKIGLGDIPGNNVAGNYVMYVLDGNGERDSQDFGFSIPDGQGEVWLEWDQG